MITPDPVLAGCRFLHDTALMLIWGASAFLLFLVPPALAAKLWRTLAPPAVFTVLIAILTTVLLLPLQAGVIGDGWGDAFNPSMLHDVVFATTVGRAWLVQAGTCLIFGLALVVPTGLRPASLALGAGLGLASLTLTGHASMHQGWMEIAHRVNDMIHVLAGGGWLGALIPFLSILRLLGTPDFGRDAGIGVRRFSKAGHGAVALVIISGMINTTLILGRLPTDFSSPYQMLLALKIAAVAGMTALAIVNRYIFVPWMGKRPSHAVDAIRAGSIAEIGLGILAISLVAVFGMLEPV